MSSSLPTIQTKPAVPSPPPSYLDRLTGLLAIAVLGCLVNFQVRQIITASVLYDDAYFASVAKNVSAGLGYGTFYPRFVPLDPAISTGPLVVLPAAVLMWIVGNRYWVPNLSITLCWWVTLGLVAKLIASQLRASSFHVALGLIVASLLVYGTEEYGLLGEVPGVLLVVTSALLLGDDTRDVRRRAIWAGLALGCAIQCKLITAFAVPAACVFLVWRSSPKQALDRLLRFGIGISAPVLVWQLAQLCMLRGDGFEWWRVKEGELSFAVDHQALAGIGNGATASANIQHLWEICGDWTYVTAFAAATTISGIVVAVSSGARRGRAAASLLVASACIHAAWWLCISPTGWARHLLPGLLYLSAATALLIAECATVSPSLAMVCGLLLLTSWYPRAHHLRKVFSFDFQKSPRLSALLATTERVAELQRDDSIMLVGWGWWVARDVDYMLPGTGNFQDWSRLPQASPPGKRIVLVRNEYFNSERSESLDARKDGCDRQLIFRRAPYVVSECLPPRTER